MPKLGPFPSLAMLDQTNAKESSHKPIKVCDYELG